MVIITIICLLPLCTPQDPLKALFMACTHTEKEYAIFGTLEEEKNGVTSKSTNGGDVFSERGERKKNRVVPLPGFPPLCSDSGLSTWSHLPGNFSLHLRGTVPLLTSLLSHKSYG